MKRLVLLLLLAACAQPITRPEPELLPPLPNSIPSQLGPVAVLVVDSLHDDKGQALLGGFHTLRRSIYIRREITKREVQHYVLAHETCHVWIHDGGLDNLIPPPLVQAICDAFAAQRVAEMLTQAKR
jgi:Zn-dependent peptidase ImmA (M78 family)